MLLDGGTARPYMKTRMPQYGHELVAHLADAFLTEDSDGGTDKLIDYVWVYRGKRPEGDEPWSPGGAVAVRHVPMPCCCDPASPSEDPCDRTASDHLMVVADFSAA